MCLCVVLPAVGPAPAGAAAAGSPAASAPPPAVYGYTPNQSADPASTTGSQSESNQEKWERIGAQATSDISGGGNRRKGKRKEEEDSQK